MEPINKIWSISGKHKIDIGRQLAADKIANRSANQKDTPRSANWGIRLLIQQAELGQKAGKPAGKDRPYF